MRRRVIGGLCFGLLAVSEPAAAELSASLGLEYFRWKESTTPSVTETGPMLAVGLAYTQEKDGGLLFAYRGRAYFGDVDYQGAELFTATPVSSTTSYAGIANEGQARWRAQIPGMPDHRVDYVLALGWDTWERKLGPVQKEDYGIAYLRVGGEVALKKGERWTVGAGVKYPVFTREDAHMTDIGFDRNPTLKPGGDINPYADVSYRFAGKFSVTAYYDGFEFKQSRSEAVTSPASGPVSVFQPPSSMSVIGLKLEYRLR